MSDEMTDNKTETPAVAERTQENAEVTGSGTMPQAELNKLTDDIIAGLKTVYDPEIPADIYELGLIYKVDIEDDRSVKVDMTLTTPNCPSAGELPQMVENAVASVPGVSSAKCNVVWDPPWDPDKMSEAAKLQLGML